MTDKPSALSRRKALQTALAGAAAPLAASTAAIALAGPSNAAAGARPSHVPEWALATPQGVLRISALSDRALRVRFLPRQRHPASRCFPAVRRRS
jgi:alpha-D-xyloside xylohydrolase